MAPTSQEDPISRRRIRSPVGGSDLLAGGCHPISWPPPPSQPPVAPRPPPPTSPLTFFPPRAPQKFFWSIVYVSGMKSCKKEAANEVPLGTDWRRLQGARALHRLHRTLGAGPDWRGGAIAAEARPPMKKILLRNSTVYRRERSVVFVPFIRSYRGDT